MSDQPTKQNQNLTNDEIQATLKAAAAQGVSTDLAFDRLPSTPAPDLGGESKGQATLNEAKRQGIATDVSFDDLPGPNPLLAMEADETLPELLDLDEGPRPSPMDAIQNALFTAARQKIVTDMPLDALPPPSDSKPVQKVVRFPLQPVPQPSANTPRPRPQTADFWLMLPLFILFRGLTLFLLRPGGFIRDWSDFNTYLGIAQLSDYGLFPFLHFWLEWPPLLPWLAVGVYKLTLFLPPWPEDQRLWFVMILGTVFLLFEVGNFALIYRLAQRMFPKTEVATINRVLWLYVGLFPPVYAMLGFFDGIALFFILLALELLLEDQRFLSAIVVGIGFMVKLIPALMLPVAVQHIWHRYQQNPAKVRRELGLYGLGFGLTVFLLALPFLLNGSPWLQTSLRAMLGRSSWETVWAVAEGYYGFGAVLGDRLNPAETNFAVHPAILPWWLITLMFAVWYLLIASYEADYSQPRQIIAFTGLTVTILLLYSKGYSPQFLIYLLPFIILFFPNERGLVYALVLTGLNVLEQPIYFVLIPSATWLLTFVVVSRFIVLLALAFEFATKIKDLTELSVNPVNPANPVNPVKSINLVNIARYVNLVNPLIMVALLILTPFLWQAYHAQRLNDSPAATFINFMQTKARPTKSYLLVSEPTLYRELYPYLHHNFNLLLAGGEAQYDQAPDLPALLENINNVWVVPTGQQQQPVSDYFATYGQRLSVYNFANFGTLFHYDLNHQSPTVDFPVARFIGGIELLDYQVELEPSSLPFLARSAQVTLFWQTASPQRNSYKVFTQLLNTDGVLVASHDGIPVNAQAPTDSWPLNTIQRDPHRIDLPSLPAGNYTFIVGLYNTFGERLLTTESNAVTLRYRLQVSGAGIKSLVKE